MALGTYEELTAAISDWEERTFASTKTDEFIALAEAKANRKLQQDFRRRTSATVNTDADGLGVLPTGFVGVSSVLRNLIGSVPLRQVSWDAMIERNPYRIGDNAGVYAINGTSIMVAPVTDDDFLIKFASTLTALSAAAPTNWLLTLAPDYYLFGCQAAASAFLKDYSTAMMLQAQADDILADLVSQGNVAEYGNAEMTLAMVTP